MVIPANELVSANRHANYGFKDKVNRIKAEQIPRLDRLIIAECK